MRLGPLAIVVTVITGFILLISYLNSTAASYFTQESAGLPAPLANNVLATELFYGITIGLLLGLAFKLPTSGRIRRTRPTLTRRQTLTAGPSTSSRPRSSSSPVRARTLHAPKIAGWRPLPPMFKYFGGKSRLAPRIVQRIPEHKTWVEPFAGGASVTLAKPPSPKEVLADKRQDLVRFYNRAKTGDRIALPADSKSAFDRIRRKPESARTPGEFVRLQGNSFGGHGQSYAAGSGTTGTLLNKRLPLYAERLAHTKIILSDYKTTIRNYDSPRTAIYIDPPYPTTKLGYTDYGRTIPTVQEIKETVDHAKGKVMISYPNLPEVKEAFRGRKWRIERLTVLNAMYASTGGPKTRTELLITNYNPARDHWQPETVLG